MREDATPFLSGGECASYGAQGGTLYNVNEAPCLNGGWQSLFRSDESTFNSQFDCVIYVRGGGTPLTLLGVCRQQLADAGLSEPANANYILGTSGNDDFTSRMTAGNDVVCGFAGFNRVNGPGGGNVNAALKAGDVFLGGDGPDDVHTVNGGTYNGGAGDDDGGTVLAGTFNGGAGNEDLVSVLAGTINGGDGDDFLGRIYDLDGTFNGGDGDDTVEFMHGGAFNGGAGFDQVFDCYDAGTLDSIEQVSPRICEP